MSANPQRPSRNRRTILVPSAIWMLLPSDVTVWGIGLLQPIFFAPEGIVYRFAETFLVPGAYLR